MPDQGVVRVLLQRRSQQLVSVVVAQIVALRHIQPRIILRPRLNLAFRIVSVIELRKKDARACLILNLLEALVLEVQEVGVICRASIRVGEGLEPICYADIAVVEGSQLVCIRAQSPETVVGPGFGIRGPIDRAVAHPAQFVVGESDRRSRSLLNRGLVCLTASSCGFSLSFDPVRCPSNRATLLCLYC